MLICVLVVVCSILMLMLCFEDRKVFRIEVFIGLFLLKDMMLLLVYLNLNFLILILVNVISLFGVWDFVLLVEFLLIGDVDSIRFCIVVFRSIL